MKGKIIVTGGAGYIGSFIVRELDGEGYVPVIVDDMSSGHEDAVKGFELHQINISTEPEKLSQLMIKQKAIGVIHMASFIQMGESFRDPGKYFRNNLSGAINLLDAMVQSGCKHIVFSSSAGVYGTPEKLPISEEDPKKPENPYGETKLMIESMLKWWDRAHSITSVSIRYFNAAGAALDGSIGEDHPSESHIIPIFIKAALKGKSATIFGDDYDTPDGTCVRDYVHVLDLSRAHTLALAALINGAETTTYNAGVGKGYSNKELLTEIKRVTGGFEYEVGPRRPGDAATLYAATEKIKKELGWEPEYGLKEIIETAYKWHKNNPEGYNS